MPQLLSLLSLAPLLLLPGCFTAAMWSALDGEPSTRVGYRDLAATRIVEVVTAPANTTDPPTLAVRVSDPALGPWLHAVSSPHRNVVRQLLDPDRRWQPHECSITVSTAAELRTSRWDASVELAGRCAPSVFGRLETVGHDVTRPTGQRLPTIAVQAFEQQPWHHWLTGHATQAPISLIAVVDHDGHSVDPERVAALLREPDDVGPADRFDDLRALGRVQIDGRKIAFSVPLRLLTLVSSLEVRRQDDHLLWWHRSTWDARIGRSAPGGTLRDLRGFQRLTARLTQWETSGGTSLLAVIGGVIMTPVTVALDVAAGGLVAWMIIDSTNE